jgi:hypothetical protein
VQQNAGKSLGFYWLNPGRPYSVGKTRGQGQERRCRPESAYGLRLIEADAISVAYLEGRKKVPFWDKEKFRDCGKPFTLQRARRFSEPLLGVRNVKRCMK